MTTPLDRIKRGAVALGVIFALSVLGYRLAGWNWLDAIYMVAITISTVGYGEIGPTTPTVRVLTIAVIIFGISASAYTFGGFVQLLAHGEIQRSLGMLRMTREIGHLKDHIIVCGFGRIGRTLCHELHRDHRQFVVVDHLEARTLEAQELHYHACTGDATDEAVLERMQIVQATTLLTTLPDDASNVFIALTARNLNSKLNIIARAEQPSTQKKLLQAGANHVVMPTAIGARQMAAMVIHPSAVEFLELIAGRGQLDVEIDEYQIPPSSKLTGKTAQEVESRIRHGILVVAVKDASGQMLFNPDPEHVFEAGQTLILMGKIEALRKFREDLGI